MPHDAPLRVLSPFPFVRPFDYAAPSGMTLSPGDYVRVPLGKKETPGVVWDKGGDESFDPARLKSVLQKYDLPPLPEAHRKFIEKVAAYTMSDVGSVLKMTLSVEAALEKEEGVVAYIPTPATAGVHISTRAMDPGLRRDGKKSQAREKIFSLLSDNIPRRAAEIAKAAGVGPAVIKSMEKAGEIRAVKMMPSPPGALKDVAETTLHLSEAQQAAADALIRRVRAGKFSATLLDGVTGSGKTEVYFEAVAETLKQGRQALVLLPEIALSAQFLERFQRRFDAAPALWHSEVSPARRRLTWRGVAEGKTRVVVGARSALFLPYPDLGLIVVDEEHDASYKQEEGVLYHARDMAVLRAHLSDVPAVLVSATPSLETVENARKGKYGVLRLPERFAGAQLPPVRVVDLRQDRPERQRFISPPLKEALVSNFAAGEQSLLFLNRRGYAPLTLCRTCGHRFQCPSCAAWLVEHKKHARLQCHHCGHSLKLPKNCPSCKDENSFAACGPGVERIEEEVRELLPEARVLVLASDNMTSASAIRDAIRAVENRDVDIIVGTQIVAKGHHFPALTLVGVIDADLGLSGGDPRAGERTFQLLQQVSGRAGRGDRPGRVFLQTYMPEQPVIRALAAGDRDAFLAAEARERERGGLPPFGRLAALIVSGKNEAALDLFCRELARAAPREDGIRVLGPAPAPIGFLRGKHRRRFLVKAVPGLIPQKYVDAWLAPVKTPSSLQLKVDIDPQSFF